jgi:hypothetical protein
MFVIKDDAHYGIFMLLAKLRVVKVQGVIDARPIKFKLGHEDVQVNNFKITWIENE